MEKFLPKQCLIYQTTQRYTPDKHTWGTRGNGQFKSHNSSQIYSVPHGRTQVTDSCIAPIRFLFRKLVRLQRDEHKTCKPYQGAIKGKI